MNPSDGAYKPLETVARFGKVAASQALPVWQIALQCCALRIQWLAGAWNALRHLSGS
jgi:hypothetical protein